MKLFHSAKFQPLKCPLSWRNSSRRLPFSNSPGTQWHSLRAGALVWVGYHGQRRWRTANRRTHSSRQLLCPRYPTQTSEPARRLPMALLGPLSDGITSRKRGLTAEYCSKWRQRCSKFGLLWRRILDEKPTLQRPIPRWVKIIPWRGQAVPDEILENIGQ